jgi:hypothetical protein
MNTDILAGAALIFIGILIIMLVIESYYHAAVERERQMGASNFEEGYTQGWGQHVAAYRAESNDYDRGYTDGWCALLDILDDPKSPGPDRTHVIVRRKP